MTKHTTPSAQYSMTMRLECPHQAGWIARISAAIGEGGGVIGAIDLAHIRDGMSVRDYSAVVVLAGFMNALKITGADPQNLKVVVAGAGAAGIACTRMLAEFGVGNLVVCDIAGAIHRGRQVGDNPAKLWAAEHTNPERESGPLKEVIRGADMFIGLSAPNILGREDIQKMHERPIVFAMGNPVPEVSPEKIADIVGVMATGRSDYPNQVNNVLAFPGIFRGTLDARASDINGAMKYAAAEAIATEITDQDVSPEYIIPSAFNQKVAERVASAVARAAQDSTVARRLTKDTSVYHS